MTVEEYVAFENASDVRHEFWNGEVFAMAGGSPTHNMISANLGIGLGAKLRTAGCFGLHADQRVVVESTGFESYPAYVVACGEMRFSDRDPYALTNPVALFEVLSPSTERHDRTFKLDQYRRIPTVAMVVLVEQSEKRVECYVPTETGWHLRVLSEEEDVLQLPIEGVSTTVAEIYDRIDFTPPLDAQDVL